LEATMTFPVEPICVVIARTRHKMVRAEILEAGKQGANLIEVRLDFLAKAADFHRLLENRPCPLVATCRRPVDGGRWKADEANRLTLLRQAIVAGFDWVDLETDVADSVRRFRDVKRIVSYHNLREMPDDLEGIYAAMSRQDADVLKIAVRAQHPNDNLRVLKLLEKPVKPTVAFCVGDMGFASRLLGAKYGMPWTYGAFNPERSITPGLPSYSDLKRIYHYAEITRDTRIYGVIGDPVSHSLSPLIHNQAFRAMEEDALYLPFRVPRFDLKEFLDAFDVLPVCGYSITIPHKEEAAKLALKQDPTVTRSGAANTLIRGHDGWYAYNTDYAGMLESLKNNLPKPSPVLVDGMPVPSVRFDTERPFEGRVVLILGAGGVAHAVAHALHREGALITIANRTAEKAQKLAGEVGCRYIDWAGRHNIMAELLINCTSVGMHPYVDESPIHASYLRPGLMVYDIVYTPEQTLLVKEARSRGCHVVTGVDLFLQQAALQFQLFTRQTPPMEVIRQVIRRALSPVLLPPQPLPPVPQRFGAGTVDKSRAAAKSGKGRWPAPTLRLARTCARCRRPAPTFSRERISGDGPSAGPGADRPDRAPWQRQEQRGPGLGRAPGLALLGCRLLARGAGRPVHPRHLRRRGRGGFSTAGKCSVARVVPATPTCRGHRRRSRAPGGQSRLAPAARLARLANGRRPDSSAALEAGRDNGPSPAGPDRGGLRDFGGRNRRAP
jgi:3-dehydroquinate dehydratase/shikimate dehydrogenase